MKPRTDNGWGLPIFYEKAASMAMQEQAMLMTKKAAEFLTSLQGLYGMQVWCAMWWQVVLLRGTWSDSGT